MPHRNSSIGWLAPGKQDASRKRRSLVLARVSPPTGANVEAGAGCIEFSVEWTGLTGRKLTVLTESNRYLGEDFTCLQDEVSTYVESNATTVVDTLPELTRRLVEPLYTAFDFFQPPDALYAEEINRMRRRGD
jgi:hypothetical protein